MGEGTRAPPLSKLARGGGNPARYTYTLPGSGVRAIRGEAGLRIVMGLRIIPWVPG